MELINYLNENYYTKQQLLDLTKISETELNHFQQQKVMPTCSYKLALNYSTDSVFGEFTQKSDIEYYAKGYLSWLGMLKITTELDNVFPIFSQRYRQAIAQLKLAGFHSNDEKVNAKFDLHIEEEWQNF